MDKHCISFITLKKAVASTQPLWDTSVCL